MFFARTVGGQIRVGPSMAFSLSQIDVAPQRSGVFSAALAPIERWMEVERERLALWVPVMLAVGIGMWFALPNEGGWMGWVGLCSVVVLAAARLPGGSRLRGALVVGGFLAAAGCILIWSKALTVGARPLDRAVHTQVEGRVVGVEAQPAQARYRLLIEPLRPIGGMPSRIRVNVDEKDMPADAGNGAHILFRARLMPPPSPAVPGAYDFAERAFFLGIGATGRALPPISVLESGEHRAAGLRRRLADHILDQLGRGGDGAIAATLATGDRGAINDEDAEAMRRSGLAHLLSISGLHVSALIGATIFIVYRLLALSPRLALTLPLMTVAAAAGALAGIGYTLFTGAEVPTVRSCIAALLVLGGLALGREAISLRLVATGALVVLLFWPESLVGPSFQMSFAAVTVIVALAETPRFRAITHARDESWPRKAGRALLATFLIGLAVEFALMPIAMFHFHQAGVLGSLANLIAIPLTTFVVMPAEALALALDIFGLGAPLWWIVGKALMLLLAVAHGVAGNGLALWSLPWFPGWTLAVVITGVIWLIIWRTPVRFLGVPVALAGVAAMALTPAPDLLVTGDGKHMAVRQADGRMALLRGRACDYVRDILSASAGDGEGSVGEDDALAPLEGARNVRCSRDLCAVLVEGSARDWLILATRSDMIVPWRALADACARADIVVSDRRLPPSCVPRWLKLDRARLRTTGGVAAYLHSQRWTSVLRADDRHPWLWQRPGTQ